MHPFIQQAFSGCCTSQLSLGYNVVRNNPQTSVANNQILTSSLHYYWLPVSCGCAPSVFQLLGSRIREQPLSGMCCPCGRGGRELVESDTSYSFFLKWPTVASSYISLAKTSHMIMRDVMGRKATAPLGTPCKSWALGREG